MEALLIGPLEVLGVAETPSGVQGAKILTLRSKRTEDGVVFRAKWRPQSSADLLNEPRKELAAYAVQKLFLDESDYVVPPTVAQCLPLTQYRRFERDEPSSFRNLDCVFGFASYWVEEAETVRAAREEGWMKPGSGIWDAELFRSDPIYRRSVASGNLLTYAINHGDAHEDQFLLQRTSRGLRAFVVDNSISFRSMKNPLLLFREDWSNIQVPLLPKSAVERLQALAPADYERLGTVAELQMQGRQLSPVPPDEVRPGGDGSTMSWRGNRMRVGLTTAEVDLVSRRVRTLLARRDLPQITEP